ncbi:hypothetical protein WJX74_008756 [Apatococcus lobatus]|uniref:Uncharacterized protein n=1 Tax=Apatococcus lobatus TaxID=904363 RepID=A0AAW1QH29_9CHLO
MSRYLLVGGSLAGAWLLRKVFRTDQGVEEAEGAAFRDRPIDLQGSATSPQVSKAKHSEGQGFSKTTTLVLLVLALVVVALVFSLRAAILAVLCSVATVWVFGGKSRPQELRQLSQHTRDNTSNAHRLAGAWVKDKRASSSMDGVLDLAEIHGLLRQAINLLTGCEISVEDGIFNFIVTSAVSWFKIIERYPLTGEPKRCRRRDLRRGKHVGSVEQKDSCVYIHMDWEAPIPGYGCDQISSPSENTLLIKSSICIGGQRASWTAVYHRKGSKS